MPSLPVDVCELICRHLKHANADLRPVALVNRNFANATASHLYPVFVLGLDENGLRKLEDATSSHIAYHVKNLSVKVESLCDHHWPSLLGRLRDLVQALPNCTSLHIELQRIPNNEDSLGQDFISTLANSLPLFTMLKLESFSLQNFPMEAFLPACFERTATGITWSSPESKVFYEQLLQLHVKIVRTSLSAHLKGSQEEYALVTQWMRAASNLEVLRLRVTRSLRYTLIRMDNIHTSTLKTLQLAKFTVLGDDLVQLARSNSGTLKRVTLETISLDDGFWHEIFVALEDCGQLSSFDIWNLGYSGRHWRRLLRLPSNPPRSRTGDSATMSTPLKEDDLKLARLEYVVNQNRSKQSLSPVSAYNWPHLYLLAGMDIPPKKERGSYPLPHTIAPRL